MVRGKLVTGPDATGPKCLRSVPKRHRGPPRIAWNNIRKRLEELYITDNKTLRETMEVLAREYDFRAGEHMYKKHIKAWGLQKHVKAEEKASAVAQLVQHEPLESTGTFDHINFEKLLRYARSCVRSGRLEPMVLSRIERWRSAVQYTQTVDAVPHVAWHYPGSYSSHLPRSPVPPDCFHSFELFLVAMKCIIIRERHEWLSRQQATSAPDKIFKCLVDGLAHGRAGRLTESRAAFNIAAMEFQNDIENPVPSVSRITYCISSILWGVIREPAFLHFAVFMARASNERLGPDHVLTVLLRHIQQEKSVDAQVRIWDCALNDYQLDEVNSEHWYNMAQRRWEWCWRSGLVEDAQRHRDYALKEMERIGKLTSDMSVEARSDFDSTLSMPWVTNEDSV